jgi:uncharacterized protein
VVIDFGVAMSLPTIALLFAISIVAGSINAVAGGGTFLTFPSLLAAGIPPINANATNTVAIWPGSAASVGAYRNQIVAQDKSFVVLLSAVSVVGGLFGAVLLLVTPQSTFAALIPYLLLLATVVFTFGPSLTGWVRARRVKSARRSAVALVGIALFQLAVAIYGGYFGAGIGIMMLAALGLFGMENIHEMNGLKALLAVFINGVAVVTFVLAGIVAWGPALVMLVGTIIGGYGTAAYVQRVDQRWVRGFVIFVGVTMTVYFFVKG